jgi:hypothetical protein
MRMNIVTRVIACFVMAAAVAGCDVTTTTPSPVPTASPSPIATGTVEPTASATIVASASSSPAATDAEDEALATDAPGSSFTLGPSGAPAPTSSQVVRLPGEPDPALTPGALNPAVTQANIRSTVCVSGWTDTIRPPTSYTNKLKVEQIAQYGYTAASVALYEEDHLISLQLGGSPTDPRNLWPEPYTISLQSGQPSGARIKDTFETALKKKVCAGTMTLVEAQRQIGVHWVHAFYSIP